MPFHGRIFAYSASKLKDKHKKKQERHLRTAPVSAYGLHRTPLDGSHRQDAASSSIVTTLSLPYLTRTFFV